jgi:transketolase
LQWCVEAGEKLKAEGVKVRVVSMPSWELFERQPREYRELVLPPSVRKRLSVEAGVTLGWESTWGWMARPSVATASARQRRSRM